MLLSNLIHFPHKCDYGYPGNPGFKIISLNNLSADNISDRCGPPPPGLNKSISLSHSTQASSSLEEAAGNCKTALPFGRDLKVQGEHVNRTSPAW
jgi:hypothetical protein